MYVGRLAAEKNLPDVFRAYSMMRVVQPSAKLVLVGDGPERARLAQEFPQAIFSGIRVREHLATQYASADIFLFPSITETYGNVTVEAMASGLAVIAYDCAAAKQHIRHNINGLLAPFDATDDFVKLATALAPDTSRIRAMGAAARASAEKMDCKSATVNYEQALLVLSTDQTEPLFPANAIA